MEPKTILVNNLFELKLFLGLDRLFLQEHPEYLNRFSPEVTVDFEGQQMSDISIMGDYSGVVATFINDKEISFLHEPKSLVYCELGRQLSRKTPIRILVPKEKQIPREAMPLEHFGYKYSIEELNNANFTSLKSRFLGLPFKSVVPRRGSKKYDIHFSSDLREKLEDIPEFGLLFYDQLDFLAGKTDELEDIFSFSFVFEPCSFRAVKYRKSEDQTIAYFRRSTYIK